MSTQLNPNSKLTYSPNPDRNLPGSALLTDDVVPTRNSSLRSEPQIQTGQHQTYCSSVVPVMHPVWCVGIVVLKDHSWIRPLTLFLPQHQAIFIYLFYIIYFIVSLDTMKGSQQEETSGSVTVQLLCILQAKYAAVSLAIEPHRLVLVSNPVKLQEPILFGGFLGSP